MIYTLLKNKAYSIYNSIILKHYKVSIGNKYQICGKLHISGVKNGIVIGDNFKANSSIFSNPTSGFSSISLVSEEVNGLIIGDNVGISNSQIYASRKVVIGDSVMIGSGVKIWDTDFHSIYYEERNMISDRKKYSNSICIEEGAFIGGCSIILKGVNIGKNSVIGAGSVVTHDIPERELWAGNPARFIKKI